MRLTTFLFLLLASLSIISFSACQDDDATEQSLCSSDFDQAAMFQNIADQLIIPSYDRFQESVNDLQVMVETFTANPDVSNLEQARTAFKTAYLSWQEVAQYNFGPAEQVFLRSSLNNFPTNVQAIENNINTGAYDFDQPDKYDKGFPAIDYILFGTGDTAESTVDFLTSNTAYLDYLNALVLDMKSRMDKTVEGWADGYKQDFIANTGTAAGTSLSLLINNLNQNYELIKREKIGVPSGVLSLGFTNPENVEALYSGISIELASKALEATQLLYKGGDDLGLDDYLIEVKAEKDGMPLDDLIQARFEAAISTVAALAGPLSMTVDEDQAAVENAYNEIVKQLVNIKTDLPSVLCVSITYIDNPSDSD